MSGITNEILEAKKFLKSKGYYTDCMWQTKDVTDMYNCSDEEAYQILANVVGTDCSETFEKIDIQASMMDIKRKEDSDE
tara:strand:+ start:13 stop:249 length:237 start_codon:yes stop_codon:yes gene_type:complete